jgi:hypothetical protein
MFRKQTFAWTIVALGLFVALTGLLAVPVNAVDDGSPVAQDPSPRPGWDATLTPTATLMPTATPIPTATPVPPASSGPEPEPPASPAVTLLPETGAALPFGIMLTGFAMAVVSGAILLARHKKG